MKPSIGAVVVRVADERAESEGEEVNSGEEEKTREGKTSGGESEIVATAAYRVSSLVA